VHGEALTERCVRSGSTWLRLNGDDDLGVQTVDEPRRADTLKVASPPEGLGKQSRRPAAPLPDFSRGKTHVGGDQILGQPSCH